MINKYFGEYVSILPKTPDAVCTSGHHNDILRKLSTAHQRVYLDLSFVIDGYLNASDWASATPGYLVSKQDYSANAYRIESMGVAINHGGDPVITAANLDSGSYGVLGYVNEHAKLLNSPPGLQSGVYHDGTPIEKCSIRAMMEEGDDITLTVGETYSDREGETVNTPTIPYTQREVKGLRDIAEVIRKNCEYILEGDGIPNATKVTEYRFTPGSPQPSDRATIFFDGGCLKRVLNRQSLLEEVDYSGDKLPLGQHGLVLEEGYGLQLANACDDILNTSYWIRETSTTTSSYTSDPPLVGGSIVNALTCDPGDYPAVHQEVLLPSNPQWDTVVVGCWRKGDVDPGTFVEVMNGTTVLRSFTLCTGLTSVDRWYYDWYEVSISGADRIKITHKSSENGLLWAYGTAVFLGGVADPTVGIDKLTNGSGILQVAGPNIAGSHTIVVDVHIPTPSPYSYNYILEAKMQPGGTPVYTVSYKEGDSLAYFSVKDTSNVYHTKSFLLDYDDRMDIRIVITAIKLPNGKHRVYFNANGHQDYVEALLPTETASELTIGDSFKGSVARVFAYNEAVFYDAMRSDI